MIDHTKDGIDHINVYSKGKTELGRLLTNFAYTPFVHPELGNFKCVEGYWYFIMTENPVLRTTGGWDSKQKGREFPQVRDHPTKEELKTVYKAKLNAHPRIKQMLLENELPLVHYYNYGGKVVSPDEWQWTASLWNEIKEELK